MASCSSLMAELGKVQPEGHIRPASHSCRARWMSKPFIAFCLKLISCLSLTYLKKTYLVFVKINKFKRKTIITSEHRVLSSEDAGHRDWQNVRKNYLQNTAKEPKKPTTTSDVMIVFILNFLIFIILKRFFAVC